VNFEVLTILPFEKELKKLSKKYPSLKDEYLTLVDSLETNPIQGISLGKDCYKIRLAIKSKKQGKSGGARVIACVKIINQKVYYFLFMINLNLKIFLTMIYRIL
jgi:hypothetical protein